MVPAGISSNGMYFALFNGLTIIRMAVGRIILTTGFAALLLLSFGGCNRCKPLPAESDTNASPAPARVPGIAKDLVAQWTCDEGAGLIINDNTYHAFDLTMEGDVRWIPADQGGYALRFNPSGMAFSRTPEILRSLSSLHEGTISLWFYYRGISGDQKIAPLLYFGEEDAAKRQNYLVIEIGHPENEYLYFTIARGGRILQCFDSNVTIEKNRWYHFAAVVGPGGNTGYLDGVELTNRHYNFGRPGDTEFFGTVGIPDMFTLGFGTTGIDDRFESHSGSMDDIAVFDRALSSEEIRELFQR